MRGDIHLDILLRVIRICTYVHCILLARAYVCPCIACTCICLHVHCILLILVMCYATTVCSTRVVRVGLCVRSFGRGFLPIYESREVSTYLTSYGAQWSCCIVKYTIEISPCRNAWVECGLTKKAEC